MCEYPGVTAQVTYSPRCEGIFHGENGRHRLDSFLEPFLSHKDSCTEVSPERLMAHLNLPSNVASASANHAPGVAESSEVRARAVVTSGVSVLMRGSCLCLRLVRGCIRDPPQRHCSTD